MFIIVPFQSFIDSELPPQVINPGPTDGATNQSVTVTLSWEEGVSLPSQVSNPSPANNGTSQPITSTLSWDAAE